MDIRGWDSSDKCELSTIRNIYYGNLNEGAFQLLSI